MTAVGADARSRPPPGEGSRLLELQVKRLSCASCERKVLIGNLHAALMLA